MKRELLILHTMSDLQVAHAKRLLDRELRRREAQHGHGRKGTARSGTYAKAGTAKAHPMKKAG